MGSSSGNRGAIAISRHLKVLLPSSTSHKLRISDELARHWDGGAGGTALVVSPLGKVWRVQVARDAGGAFLGRGWPEFAAAHGFGAGWFLVFRHEPGGGVLTVKAFDTTCCLREFSRPITAANPGGGGGGSHRPQFINVLLPPSMEKMGIPPKFVKNYISEVEMGSSVTVLLSPLSKFCRVTVGKDQSSGNLFFSGGWSRFLASNGITEYDVLLLRYEGNMVFTVKVFGPDGCQKGYKDQGASSKKQEQSAFADTKTEEEDPPSSSRKGKGMEKKPGGEENSKRPTSPITSSNKAQLSMNRPVYKVGPPSWIKKEISSSTLWKRLTIPRTFCKAVRLLRTSEVTLRTTADEDHGHRSWQVRFLFYENRNSGELSRGWRRFCTDNRIKEGDICTFNVIETTLWHVDITRHGEDQGTISNELEQSDKTPFSDTEKEDVPSSSRKRKCEDKKPDGEENSKRTKGPTTSLNEAPSSIVYEIGPPSWLKREISAHMLSDQLYVPRNFYKAIGLNRSSEITLRTTTNEDHGLRSWQVRFLVYRNRGTLTRGWRTFWADNMIKEGVICTFNIIETTLWHVDITRHCEDQGTISNELEQNDKMTLSDTVKEDVPSSSRKRKCEDKKPDGEENSKRTKGPTTSLNKAPASIVYDIGPQSLFKTEISAYILSLHLSVPRNFWKATGLCRTSDITLRTMANEDHGLRSWQVRFLVSGNHGMLTRGWRTFLVDNRIKEGDICTFKIIKTTLWHVDIMRHG